jgi:parallel beta-helix repeat protein
MPVISSEISNSSSYGIRTNSCSPLIEVNTIENNESHGLYNYGGSPTVRNNTITGNHYGIYTQYATPAIDGNTITDNDGYGIYFYDARNAPEITNNTITGNLISILVPACALPDETNVLTPNTRKYIGIQGNDIQSNKVLKIWGKGTPDEISTYMVYSSNITVPAYTYLTVDPGVTVKFSSNLEITVNGVLIADGTLDEKIVFTSVKDDSHGGDTNNDGSNSIPENGNWRGITFNNSFFEDLTHLNHVKVRYAGANNSGAIYFYQADILVENSEISNSSTNGIRVYNASPTLTGNNIWGNSADGIRLEYYSNAEITFSSISSNMSDGIEVTGSSNAIATNNRIFTNRGYGLRNSTTNSIDATQTWWGDSDASGPYHVTTNPDGTGNQVSDNVVYDPWQTTVATEFSYVNFSAASGSTYGSMSAPALTQGYLSDTWGTSPDRSMAWADESNGETVIVDYTGLDTEKRYKVRVSYFNGDPAGSVQSLTDGNDNQIHGSMIMPTSSPVQYEFSIPTVSYNTDGNLRLKFVHDNPDTSIRVAVPEIWLMEDIPELTPPRFIGVGYNDADGSSTLTEGDEFYFHFSEEMDTSLIADGTTDANDKLVPEGDLIYGSVNQSRWTTDNKTVIVAITAGFRVTGTEIVTTSGLVDLFGNTAIGSQTLSLTDTIAPAFTGIDWVDVDASTAVSLGDQYVFHFNETMDVSVIQDGTQDANVYMRPAGGLRYGDVNTVIWSLDGKDLTVTITEGYTVLGDEQVIPSSFVKDMAGNSVMGTQNLLGRDNTPPEFVGIRFNDVDASGTVTIGDSYTLDFSEPIRSAVLSDGTTEANANLSPSGKRYGTLNRITWNSDYTGVTVEVTAGFTVNGGEIVTPSAVVTDRAGNPVSNTIDLVLTDTIPPEVKSVKAFYISPVSATENYKLTIQFNSSMNPSVDPVVTLSSSGSINPVVPAGGQWLTTRFLNDTYTTPDIVLAQGMDGVLTASVAGAQDWAGNEMIPAPDVFSAVLDATPPANPTVTVEGLTCNSALLTWTGYTAPADLTGFQIYVSTGGSFGMVDGKSYTRLICPSLRSFEVALLALDTQYHLAVVAMDQMGNYTASVTSHPVIIAEATPPLPAITVSAGADPDSAVILWHGYDSSLCGFSGFKVYMEEVSFGSVTGLTEIAVLGSSDREFSLRELDRTKTYYIALVGVNSSGEYTDTAAMATWSDPYADVISSDLLIGGGEQDEITIFTTMVITNNATLTIEPGTTLHFAPGSGIIIDQGQIQAVGTALDPIVFTSGKVPPGTAAPGDWPGITINSGNTGSVLAHVFIEYGEGLQIDNAAPQVEAFTARYNSGAGLLVRNNGSLTTTEALLRYNDMGAAIETGGSLTISGSVIKNNTLNASSDGSQTMTAQGNWWGALDEGAIMATVTTGVDYSNFLDYEPVLTPAIGTAIGLTQFSIRDIEIVLAARNTEEMRLSEDSSFGGVFFDRFVPAATFTLSPIGGEKTIFAQFKSSTGAESTPVSVTVEYITEGPSIDAFSLLEGQTINRPIALTGGASAALGVNRLEFYANDALIHSELSDAFTYLWDIRSLPDGIYRVKLIAYDNGGNLSAVERNVIVEPLPTPAPQITEPADGAILSSELIDVRGTAEPGADVKLKRNGFVMDIVQADAGGLFEILDVDLQEGSNTLIATSQDMVGVSPNSNIVTVELDTGPPEAPILESVLISAGDIDLGWKPAVDGETPSYYRIYRSNVSFSDPALATLITDNVTERRYRDGDVADGIHFYGVVGVDGAGNVSDLSHVLSIEYDGTAPGLSVSYSRVPPVGVGLLGITLTVSEPLLSLPSLTIRPAGANAPVSILLTQLDELTFEGSFEILSGTATGLATVSASGTDFAGNHFSGTPVGPALVIDTDGPLGTVTVGLPAPIQVMDPVDLDVFLSLTEAAKTGTPPLLQFVPPVGNPLTVPLTGSDTDWNGILPLDAAMGSGIGTFTLLVFDELNNESNIITAGKSLEIYNTDLPDPTVPPGVPTATSLAGGIVKLHWETVVQAESYKVYRKAGPYDGPPDVLVAEGLVNTSYEDTPPADGTYCYAVSADRRGSESDLSAGAEAVSDSLAPDVPENVAANFGVSGVIVSWDSPSEGEIPVRYFVYRNGSRIRTVQGGASGSFEARDYPAARGSYEYIVASADVIGNENPSDPVPFALAVGAVTGLEALIDHGTVPLLTWASTDPSTVGYNVYRGGIKLNTMLLTQPSFEDTHYAGTSRVEYGVAAVNGTGEESPRRTVNVFPVKLSAIANPDEAGIPRPLITSYFNNLEITVANNAPAAALVLGELELEMSVAGADVFSYSRSIDESIAAGAAHVENMPFAMDTSLGAHILTIRALQPEDDGSQAIYQRDIVFSDLTNPAAKATMNIDQIPLAGGYSTVNVCIRNRGYLDMDVIVSRQNGTVPGDIFVAILNDEGLEIGRAYYQGYPDGIRFRGSTGYVRISGGGSLCVDIQVLVPESLPEGSVITFVGGAEAYTYDLTGAALTGTEELIGSMPSGITLSEYYGTAQADQGAYADDDVVTIIGQAINRETGLPEPNTPLKIGFFVRGFTWYRDITTDENGDYTYAYEPSLGVSGEFIIWAAHPDVYDIIDQDRFGFYRMYASPIEGSIRSSKADTLSFQISLINSGDIPLTEFSLAFRAYVLDGGGSEVEIESLHGNAVFPPGFEIGPEETQKVEIQLSADIDAPDSANVEYTFISSEGASTVFYGSVTLVDAVPILNMVQPRMGYVEASVDNGALVTIPVTVKNDGLIDLLDAEMTLPQNLTWITTNLPQSTPGMVSLGTIAVGESRTFDVIISPPDDTPLGDHNDAFVIMGSNSVQAFDVNVYALVTSELKGSVLFTVYNNLGQRVEEATVRIFNNVVHEQIISPDTDLNGEVVIYGLDIGEWTYQITAAGHSSISGVVKIVADQTVLVEEELVRNLITVTFNVEPVPFTDRYEIKIEQKFDTHVPVPVLVWEPPYVDLGIIEPGFTTTIITQLSNFGLKALDDITISTYDDGTSRLEPLITYMPRLGAMQTIEVPVQFTLLRGSDQLPGSAPSAKECADLFLDPTGFINGMAAIAARGRTNSYLSGGEMAVMMGMATGFALAASYGTPSGAAMNLLYFLICLLSGDGGAYGGGGGGGGGPMSSPTYSAGSGGPGCFISGTPVLMADGSLRTIETLEVGDRVMAFDRSSGLITEVYTRESDHTLELRYLGWDKDGVGTLRRLETTDEHLFWERGQDTWVPARKLKQGDLLIMPNGLKAEVTELWRREEPVTAYSFDVDGYESYYANGVLVRQKCGGPEETKAEERLRDFLKNGGESNKPPLEERLREGGDER